MTMLRIAVPVLLAGVVACGGSVTEPREEANATAGSSADLDPCSLLTASQVAAVLPGADAGFATARGRELMEGVRQYQCTYTDPESNLFLVGFDIATTDARFAEIRPGETERYVRELGARAVAVGDGGWWVQREGGPLELRATRGRTAIHLQANVPDGPARADALVAAGIAVADRLE